MSANEIEDAEKLAISGAGFSSDNLEVKTVLAENGNVKFIVRRRWGMGKSQIPSSSE